MAPTRGLLSLALLGVVSALPCGGGVDGDDCTYTCPEPPPPPPPPPPLSGCANEAVPTFTPQNCGDINHPCEVPYGDYGPRYGCPVRIENIASTTDEIFLMVSSLPPL